MTDVLEVLLELECLREDLVRHPLKEASALQYMRALSPLVAIMTMILKGIISNDCLEHLKQIDSGDMTSTNS